jgi:ATP-dependent protease ClpP protease subunit
MRPLNLVDEAIWARAARLGNLSNEERVREHAVREKKHSDKTEFFRVSNASSAVAQLEVYDEISFWGVNAADFKAELNAITASTIEVRVNSPGGDCFDGIAILNMLRSHKATVNVVVDGQACSAASIIAMAGETVTMMPGSMLMIHDASGLCFGNPADMKAMTELLDKVSQNIASVYTSKAGGSTDTWRAAMQAESWYTADEAVASGLADKVGEVSGAATENKAAPLWNLSMYQYAGRDQAPEPTLVARAPAVQEKPFEFDPASFRAALRNAIPISSTQKEAAV